MAALGMQTAKSLSLQRGVQDKESYTEKLCFENQKQISKQSPTTGLARFLHFSQLPLDHALLSKHIPTHLPAPKHKKVSLGLLVFISESSTPHKILLK